MNYNEKPEMKHLFDLMNRFDDIKILDVGCGNCEKLFDLYTFKPYLKIISLVGVDSRKKKDYFPRYKEIIKQYKYVYRGKRPIDNINAEYIIEDEMDFLTLESGFHDLIIFSNFFHFHSPEVVSKFLQLTLTNLSDRGIIYIQVANENHGFAESSEHFVFTHAYIELLSKDFHITVIPCTTNHYKLILIPHHRFKVDHEIEE